MPSASAEGFRTTVDLFRIARLPEAKSLPLILRDLGTSSRQLSNEATPIADARGRGRGRLVFCTHVNFGRKITVPALVMHSEDDQVVPYTDSGPLPAKLLKKGMPKTYKGFPRGMPTTEAATINADLLAFLKA